MFRSTIMRGVSASAITLALSSLALAQQSLPTIDVGANQSRSAPVGQGGAGGQTRSRNSQGQPSSKTALGGRLTGYNAPGPAAASKTDIPILQTPSAIQVVPRQTMDDRQAITVQDALTTNVSSVVLSGHQFYDRFIIRGFDNDRNTYRNGLRQYSLTNLETSNLQSIEVLKGPAAMLYGRVEPGGIINLVPKRPLFDEQYASIQEQVGSFGLTRTTVDATGPLNEERSLAYRFNGAYLNTQSHRDFIQRENVFVAPTISWRPHERFRINVDAEYQNVGFTADSWTAIPAIGRRPANVPIYRNYTDPTLTLAKPNRQERRFIGYDATLDINDDWKVTNRFGYWNVNFSETDPFAGSFNEATGELSRFIWYLPYGNREALAVNLDLQGKFETGPFKHRVLAGWDYFDSIHRSRSHCCDAPILNPINIWHPVYFGAGFAQLNSLTNYSYYLLKENWKGVYGQDQISFMDDKVHILFGGRYDWANYGDGNGASELAAGTAFKAVPAEAFSPRLGIVIQPAPWLSFYSNYSQSFGTSNGLTQNNAALPPQKARQFEGGIKSELFNGRLTATIAYYAITKTNILASVPGTTFVRPVGEAESNGLEFDVTGRIDDNWSVIANYSYTNARVTKDGQISLYGATDGVAATIGNRLPNVPFHAGNLWLKYNADGDFKGLSLAGGVNVIGERKGDVENTYELPVYALLNAMASYRLEPPSLPWVKRLTAQVNVNNILDTIHYTSANNGRLSITPGAPRAVMVSLRAEF
jgi:iron complex outermembrane receptor protein